MIDPCAFLLLVARCAARDAAEAAPSSAQTAGSAPVAVEPPSSASAVAATKEESATGWQFVFAPYLWIASLDGSTTVDGQEVESEDGGDGFFASPALTGFMFYVEASRGPWSISLDDFWVDASFTAAAPGVVDGEALISGLVMQSMVGYRVSDAWRVSVGARYYDLEAELDLEFAGQPATELQAGRVWVDPLVGVDYRGALGSSTAFRASADVGGFGVGSDLSWSASAVVDWSLGESWGAFVGYRALDVNFTDGGGSERVDFSLTLYGPMVGVRFSF